MSKDYDLSKVSDMERFQRDLRETIQDKAKEGIMAKKFPVTCPHCGNKVTVSTGKSPCPSCRNQIDLKLNIEF